MAYSVSELGSAVGAGTLPLIAVLVLDASPWQVSMLAAVAGIAAAVAAVPLAPWIEVHRKRPVMVAADVARFAALASVPGAHLKHLVPPRERVAANSRFETSMWSSTTVGPPVGGLLG